jgi:hypothetical protein
MRHEEVSSDEESCSDKEELIFMMQESINTTISG